MARVNSFQSKTWSTLIGYAILCAVAAEAGGGLEKIFFSGRFCNDGTDVMNAVFLLRFMAMFIPGLPFVLFWDLRRTEQARLAATDDMTGLCNHRQLMAVLNHEFARAKRYGFPLTVLMMDLDRFKAVNDRYGHLAGDAVLRDIGHILKTNTRAADICGRYGGDEFCLILPHTDEEEARALAWRLWDQIYHHSFIVNERPVQISVSAGIASLGANLQFLNAADLIHEADLAMFKDKLRKEANKPSRSEVPVPEMQSQHRGFEYLLHSESNKN